MTGTVDSLVFDLDGTLCEYRRSGEAVLAAAFETVGIDPFFAVTDYYLRFDDYVAESDDFRELRERCFADLATAAGHDPAIGRSVAEAFAAERDHSNVRWIPGAEEALDGLGQRYPLAMVTNGDPRMQGAKLDALGIDDRFETVVHAGFETPSKPNPEPFHRALDVLETDPSRAATIGNSLGHDIAGAHNAGLRSVWLDRDGGEAPDPEPHHRIESMDELLEEPWH